MLLQALHLVHQVFIVHQQLVKNRILPMRVELLKSELLLKVVLSFGHGNFDPQHGQNFGFMRGILPARVRRSLSHPLAGFELDSAPTNRGFICSGGII